MGRRNSPSRNAKRRKGRKKNEQLKAKCKMQTIYGWHWVREQTVQLRRCALGSWAPTNPPTYELVQHRGRWTITLLTESRPELIATAENFDLAKTRMCEHADRSVDNARITGQGSKKDYRWRPLTGGSTGRQHNEPSGSVAASLKN